MDIVEGSALHQNKVADAQMREAQILKQLNADMERENQKLSPRPPEGGSVENISTDECWLINIKAPATLSINRGDPDTEGNQVDK